MDNCCAPQWADFTRSPQIFSDDYFEIEHEVHKPQMYFKYSSNLSSCKQENKSEQSINETTKFDDSLEPRTPVRSSVAYFIPHDSKKHAVVQTTNNEPPRELKLDEKSSKIHQTWSISITELTSAFKVMPAQRKVKRTVPEKTRKNMSEAKSSLRDVRVNDVKKTNNPQTAFVKNKHESAMKSKVDVCSKDDPSDRRLSYKIVRVPRTQHNALNTRHSFGKPKVLTCQYRRTSLIRNQKRLNQFVSLAEAISKFQTETPERFRTLNRTIKPGLLMKLKQSPLKLTYPISPALRCKQRTRITNILNQQEREKLELENMKKHQIKANPVPVNILKAPTLLKKVPKKPPTITEEFHLTQSKKTRHTTDSSVNIQQNMNTKEHQKAVSISRSTSSSSVSCKKANSSEPEVRAAMRVEFELRNREFQLKKQEKLKNLCIQESNKNKTQFHARPAPKFTKSTNAVKDQKQKKTVITRSSSLEERNRFVAKKDKPVKQFERLEFAKIPNTNSISCFIRDSEKENIRNKGYSYKALDTRQTKSFSDRENKQPCTINNTITCISTKKKQTINQQTVNHCDKLQSEIGIPFIDIKNKKLYNAQNKVDKVDKLKSNMNKKIQERNEFDDMIKKREQEFKAKKVQEERCRLLEQKMEKLKLRKMTEVKAKPMPIYKPMVIAKSTKPVTNPQSPALGIRNKAKNVS